MISPDIAEQVVHIIPEVILLALSEKHEQFHEIIMKVRVTSLTSLENCMQSQL